MKQLVEDDSGAAPSWNQRWARLGICPAVIQLRGVLHGQSESTVECNTHSGLQAARLFDDSGYSDLATALTLTFTFRSLICHIRRRQEADRRTLSRFKRQQAAFSTETGKQRTYEVDANVNERRRDRNAAARFHSCLAHAQTRTPPPNVREDKAGKNESDATIGCF